MAEITRTGPRHRFSGPGCPWQRAVVSLKVLACQASCTAATFSMVCAV